MKTKTGKKGKLHDKQAKKKRDKMFKKIKQQKKENMMKREELFKYKPLKKEKANVEDSLKQSKFRYLNELLYTQTSYGEQGAVDIFKNDPA